MDNRILANVMAEYALRRQENEQEEARRKEEMASLHPDLARLMQARHEMILRSVRGAFAGEAPADAEAAMGDYNQKIAALLQAKGYPADYLSPVCRCPLCGDTGYVYEHALQKPCECLKKAYQQALALAGEEIQQEQTFEAFDENRFPADPLPGTDLSQRDYMLLIREKCRAFAQGVPNGPVHTLLLHGGSGLGKTFLLHCIGHEVRGRGVDAVYATAYDLLMALKNAYFSRTGEGAEEYFDAPLLLIDDLGMEPLMENITVEQIYHLINARLTRGLYTAISTNLSRTELKQRYTERVSSRLLDTRTGLALPFQGKDIRLQKP